MNYRIPDSMRLKQAARTTADKSDGGAEGSSNAPADKSGPHSPASDLRPISLKPACLCLRHKLMYADSRQSSPGLIDDNSDTRVYFCTRSQDSLGPDSHPAHPRDCTAARACFKKG